MVITTYEGRHDHDLPPTRTVSHNTTGVNVHSAAHNYVSGTNVEENETICLDMIVHCSSGVEKKSSEELNGESRTKSEVSVGMIDAPILGPESWSNEQRGGKMDPSKESVAVGRDMIVHSKSSSQNTSNEQLSSKSETKSENGTVFIDKMVRITPRSECNFDEQRMPSAEPAQS